jgi:hypothetical protein
MSNLPKGAVSDLTKVAGVAASQRIAGPFSSTTELGAMVSGIVPRMVASVVTDAGVVQMWGYLETSTASASSSVVVPADARTAGRWLLLA